MAEVKVWTIETRDPWTGHDLECVVATTTRAELHEVLVRCGLRRSDADITRRKPDADDVSARALADVGALSWRDLEANWPWRDEQALTDLREQYAQRRPQGWRRP
ncbi:hypothetical protein [uncultured Pseudokineococcus sp.]|uniref:hypothetical protein n=1 Tax=uncultured Pseudokineococcus sp. TaxID=1642928 RepID=UPI00261F3127|nr:hypothetical protein [uncultured Pseudokineococcus sp.]